MTEKDIKKLSREDLLRMLIDQSEELETVKKELALAEEKLRDRTVTIDRAGSLAEAALQLNGVFEAAEASCRQYLENIRAVSERQEAVCEKREAEYKQAIAQQVEITRRDCEKLEAETRARCEAMVAESKAEADAYWAEVFARIDRYLAERKGLRELVTIMMSKKRDCET